MIFHSILFAASVDSIKEERTHVVLRLLRIVLLALIAFSPPMLCRR